MERDNLSADWTGSGGQRRNDRDECLYEPRKLPTRKTYRVRAGTVVGKIALGGRDWRNVTCEKDHEFDSVYRTRPNHLIFKLGGWLMSVRKGDVVIE